MKFSIEISNVRELVHSAGVTIAVLATHMGRSESIVAQKINGTKPLFLDEIPGIVGAVNDAKRIKVTEEEVIKLVGKGVIKVRGFVD